MARITVTNTSTKLVDLLDITLQEQFEKNSIYSNLNNLMIENSDTLKDVYISNNRVADIDGLKLKTGTGRSFAAYSWRTIELISPTGDNINIIVELF